MALIPPAAKQVVLLLWRLAALAFVAITYVPWLVVRASDRALALAVGLWRLPSRLRLALSDTVACPRCGRRQSLLGRWRCPCCKAVETTSAWAPCGVCGATYPAGYISCEATDCGEAIRNPNLGAWR